MGSANQIGPEAIEISENVRPHCDKVEILFQDGNGSKNKNEPEVETKLERCSGIGKTSLQTRVINLIGATEKHKTDGCIASATLNKPGIRWYVEIQ